MAITLPLGIRLAAGLLGTAIDRATALPTELPSMAVTFAGQALRASMRVRQELAELATRGDELLAPLVNRSQENPEWATFDEDEDDAPPASRPPRSTTVRPTTVTSSSAAPTNGAPTSAALTVEQPTSSALTVEQPTMPTAPTTAATGSATSTDSAAQRPDEPAVTLDGTPVVEPPAPGTTGPGEAVPTTAGIVVGATPPTAALVSGTPDDGTGAAGPAAAPPVANARRTTTGRARGRSTIRSDHRLTIAELKERTQQMTVAEVQALLAQEEAGPNRAAYLTLLGNRVMTLQHEDR